MEPLSRLFKLRKRFTVAFLISKKTVEATEKSFDVQATFSDISCESQILKENFVGSRGVGYFHMWAI